MVEGPKNNLKIMWQISATEKNGPSAVNAEELELDDL